MALSYNGAETRTACREERPQVCDEIRLALAEVRRRTPLAGLRGTPRGRRQGPSSVEPRQALLLLLLLLHPFTFTPSRPPHHVHPITSTPSRPPHHVHPITSTPSCAVQQLPIDAK